jgi:hypothetical protein
MEKEPLKAPGYNFERLQLFSTENAHVPELFLKTFAVCEKMLNLIKVLGAPVQKSSLRMIDK